jgi:hypothetical protein
LVPPYSFGPGDAEPALLADLGHELPPLRGVHDLGHVLASDVEHLGIVVGVEELFDLLDEFELFGSELEIHGRASIVRGRRAPRWFPD